MTQTQGNAEVLARQVFCGSFLSLAPNQPVAQPTAPKLHHWTDGMIARFFSSVITIILTQVVVWTHSLISPVPPPHLNNSSRLSAVCKSRLNYRHHIYGKNAKSTVCAMILLWNMQSSVLTISRSVCVIFSEWYQVCTYFFKHKPLECFIMVVCCLDVERLTSVFRLLIVSLTESVSTNSVC